MMSDMKHKRGFTLIELMIVITIVAILAAIAYPSYQNYILKSRRVDAEGNLLELGQYLERYFTENGRYDQDRGGTAVSLPFNKSPKEGTATFYNLAFTAGEPTATTFELSASPAGSQAEDTDCGVLSLDHTGTKCILNGSKCSNVPADAEAVDECW